MIIIGEQINATRSDVKPIIENRREDKLIELAQKLAKAGATYIDVNIGTGTGTRNDEVDDMRWAIKTIGDKVDIPLCIDSADAAVIEAGLEARENKPAMINSTKAEKKHLECIVPLAGRYNTSLIALAMDESGIPKTPEERVAACRKIADWCAKYDVPMKNVFFDPLVMPVVTDRMQCLLTLNTLAMIKKEFAEAKTVIGLSNVSFGLPARAMLNAAFLQMAMYAGLDAAIMDPLNETLVQAIRTGEALVGKDRHFRKYTRKFRGKK